MPQGAPQGFPQGGPPGGFAAGGPGRIGGRPFFFLFGGPWLALFILLTLVVLAIAFYQIYKKAGFNGLLGLLMLVPIVNFGMMLWFAFTEWPLLTQLREQRALSAMHAEQAATAQAVPTPGGPAVGETVDASSAPTTPASEEV